MSILACRRPVTAPTWRAAVAAWRGRGPGYGEQVLDLGDQGRVRGGVPGVALEQVRRGVQQERGQRAVRLGGVKRALDGAVGGGLIAERFPGSGLQNMGQSQPDSPVDGCLAVQDRGECGERGVRVISCEPQ
jgi:hypothetical protein